MNAGVQVPFNGIPAAASGTFSGSTTTINTLSAAQFATALLTGNAYANIHSALYPGGEIRGWLSCAQPSGVPEFPPALGAVAIGALLLPVPLALRKTKAV